MSLQSKTLYAAALPGIALAGLLALVPTAGHAQGAAAAETAPFAALGGAWNGTGTLSLANGTKERIRCRVSYNVGSGGSAMKQEVRCASDTYKFELNADIQSSDGNLSGRWTELIRNAGGTITGRARPGQIQALAATAGYSANLTMTTRGDKQTFSMRSPGGDVKEVAVTLNRGN